MYRYLLIFSFGVTMALAQPLAAQTKPLQSVQVEDLLGGPQPEIDRVEFQSLFDRSESTTGTTTVSLSDATESATATPAIEALPPSVPQRVTMGVVHGVEGSASVDFHCTNCGVAPCDSGGCQKCSSSRPWCCGCYERHARNIGHPALFCERPFGSCNEGFFGAMIVAGKADRAMLHHYDFVQRPDGKVTLSARGARQLSSLAALVHRYGVPLSIETTYRNGLDAARKQVVIQAIELYGLPVAADQVVIAPDRTIGLSGVDAESIATIRATEVITGASRTNAFRDSSDAVVIPQVQVSGNNSGNDQ